MKEVQVVAKAQATAFLAFSAKYPSFYVNQRSIVQTSLESNEP